jgi:IS1 family transposase
MVEADEFWSYVGNKKNQRWTWYALEKNSGVVIAWHNGRRTDESCSRLMEFLFFLRRVFTLTAGKVTENIFLLQNMSSEKRTLGG